MLFNSVKFLVFFPAVVFLYFLLPHKLRWLWLLVSSCVFYMVFVPVYILILFGTIIIDYFAGILIEQAQPRRKKLYLVVSIITNVGVLCVFKYYNFFIENVMALLLSLHLHASVPLLSILLPIGLSFHTFQAMSYTIEVYRGNQKAERHFGIYALYVMFFPQLVAGPIERPQNMLHQFHEKHTFQPQNVLDGLRQMLWGFFKKVVIADRLALYVDSVFDNYQNYHYLNIAIACVFFSFQIYCDFSGYSDIAIGAARVMGITLMNNFNAPYFSKSVREFWTRWHISLSTWFRDYLYIPLGGSRVSIQRIYFNLLVVFLLSGLWHGANWTFVIWGALNGVALCIDILTSGYRKNLSKNIPAWLYNNLSILLTFGFTTFAWIFFRAHTFSNAAGMIKKMITLDNSHPYSAEVGVGQLSFNSFSWLAAIVSLFVLWLAERYSTIDLKKFNRSPGLDIAFGVVVLTLILILGIFNQSMFIYFQF